MNKYANYWTNGETVIRSVERPTDDHIYPVYNPKRVRGAEYQPYAQRSGSPAWVAAANRAMERRARYNYEVSRQ